MENSPDFGRSHTGVLGEEEWFPLGNGSSEWKGMHAFRSVLFVPIIPARPQKIQKPFSDFCFSDGYNKIASAINGIEVCGSGKTGFSH